MEQGVEGYRGRALELLQKFDVKPSEQVRLVTSDGLETKGLIVPRYEYADDDHVVLKLKSGYNIGLKVSTIQSISLISDTSRGVASDAAPSRKKSQNDGGKKKLMLVSTGGTIASRVDYRTGAVHPALTASDLYVAVPELDRLAVVEPEVVFSIYSENMTPSDWEVLSSRIIELARSKSPDGVVVMMGTDTLAYTSAALSFSLIGFGVPVVVVGAQRSSDRPSSDAALNLRSAALFAVESNRPGVYVAMHQNENDENIAIHSGVRVRKNHTSRRDAFQSIDASLVAVVKNASEIVWNERDSQKSNISKYSLKTKFEKSVSLVKFYPGFDPNVIRFLVDDTGVRGLILEGTGLGHVSDKTVSVISDVVKKGIFVGLTSQCIWGHVDLNVYDTGRDLIAAGVTPLENMFAETAFAKLSWVMGNFPDTAETMLKNLVGEFSSRILLSSR
ncbi:MAG TPA: Glu-tRNA(Gln) amidotransferase subunit GatD [Nitrososphaerales archaeon]|nr:Glu-tRNA(Gln) amidotransferase subunit GatD [Nitrososphaerales archaeon]